jgi:hypothetical protein
VCPEFHVETSLAISLDHDYYSAMPQEIYTFFVELFMPDNKNNPRCEGLHDVDSDVRMIF